MSFESTPFVESTVKVVSSFVEPVSSVASGLSLTGLTVITNSAVSVPPFPSSAV